MPKNSTKAFYAQFWYGVKKGVQINGVKNQTPFLTPTKNTLKKCPEGCFYTKCVPDVYILRGHHQNFDGFLGEMSRTQNVSMFLLRSEAENVVN